MRVQTDQARQKVRGFTLIELLVVIAIIALLSILAAVSLSNIREKGRDTKRLSDMDTVKTAMELIQAKHGSYSKNLGCKAGEAVFGCANGLLQEEISNIKNIKDPAGTALCEAESRAVCNYRLAELTDDGYKIYFYLENGVGDFAEKGLYELTAKGIEIVNNEK